MTDNSPTGGQSSTEQNWLSTLIQRLSHAGVGTYGRGLTVPQGNVGVPSPAPLPVPSSVAPTSPGALSAAMQPGQPGSPSGPAAYGPNGLSVPSQPSQDTALLARMLGPGRPMNIAPPNAGSGQGVPLAGQNAPGNNFTPPTTSSQNILQQFAALLSRNAAAPTTGGGPASNYTGVGLY